MATFFLSATKDAAVHLGQNYQENIHSTRNSKKKKLKQLSNVSQKLISNQEEISGISTIHWDTTMGKTTLLGDRADQLPTAKIYVFFDSVLCLGKVHQHSETIDKWKEKIQWFIDSHEYHELHRIDGVPVVFEWTNFPGHTTLQLFRDIQKMMDEMNNDIVW